MSHMIPEYLIVFQIFATAIWILQGIVCYKAFLLRKYTDKSIWGGLLIIDISVFFTVAISYNLTFTAVTEFPDVYEDLRLLLRTAFPAIVVITSFWVHYIIRHRFKKFFQEEKKWSDWL